MSWLASPLALIAAVMSGAPADVDGPGGGWLDPVVLRARPLLDQPGGVRPGLAVDPRGEAVAAFVASTATGARVAVARRAPGHEAFGESVELSEAPDLRTSGGRAPTLTAGANGTFAVAWLARTGARTPPAVVASVSRPGRAFGPTVTLSRPGAHPAAVPPAVSIDRRGRVSVSWIERRGRTLVLVRRARGAKPPFADPGLARAHRELSAPAGAGPALGWAESGRLVVRLGARELALGTASASRVPALGATPDGARLAVAWVAGNSVRVSVPGLRAARFATTGRVVSGPLVDVAEDGDATVAWQDDRGVLVARAGGRAQRLASDGEGQLLSGLAVAPAGQALVTLLQPVNSTRTDAGDVVLAAVRAPGGAFRTATTLSRPGRITSLATPAFTPRGTALVAWASGVSALPEALLLVATRPAVAPGAGAAAPLAPAADAPVS